MRVDLTRSSIGKVTQLFLLASAVSLGFFVVGALRNEGIDHSYLLWNLLLAWLAFGLSVWLHWLLPYRQWTSWLLLLITVTWLGFLPNTFYMLTDFIHLHDVPRVDETYDVIMFVSFISTGVGLGYASLALVHYELRKRLPSATCWRVMALILLAVSFAIYVGRYLRWNTWDIITNPAGILFDMSERIIHPTAHPQTYITTLAFFVLLSTGYYCVWRVAGLIQNASR